MVLLMLMAHQKIIHHRHTGKVVHHQHTSYGALLLAILLTAVPLILASRSVALADDLPPPVTDTQGTYAVVAAPAPATPAILSLPTAGSVYTSNEPIQVAGSCAADTLLKVYKNNVLGGATFCEDNRFSVKVDLFVGVNTLIVRSVNANGAIGPDSSAVAVRYEVPGAANNPTVVNANQFFLTSDVQYRGVNVGETISYPLTLNGGQAPFAVNVGWGDGEVDLLSKTAAGTFDIQHAYKSPGNGDKSSYNVTITATDQQGNKSFMQMVAIVSGDRQDVAATVKAGYDLSGYLRAAWQIGALAIVIVLSFWLGERREARILRRTAART